MNQNHDRDVLALQLGHVLQGIHDLGPTEIPALLSQVATLQSALAARLLSVQDYLKDFARFGYLSGWRKGEIAGLEWRDVDRDAKVLRLRPEVSKTHEGRVLVLDGDLWALIERRWEIREVSPPEGDRLIPRVFHRKGYPIGDIRKAWKTACRKAGVPDKLFHDLRRTSVRNMVRAGVPERVAMEVSGHRTRSIFDRYHIVSEKDLPEAVRKTQAYLDTQPEDQEEISRPKGQKPTENKRTDKKRTK